MRRERSQEGWGAAASDLGSGRQGWKGGCSQSRGGFKVSQRCSFSKLINVHGFFFLSLNLIIMHVIILYIAMR